MIKKAKRLYNRLVFAWLRSKVADVETISVSWYDCDCEWTTKYCDENHRAYASVPIAVLKQYKREVR